MAINSKNYVDISTTFPMAGSRSRAFGGLVFTYDGLLGVAVDSDTGLPVPKDEDGVPYPKENGSYVIKVNNVSYPFVWDAKSGYVATVGNKQYSPANSSVIHAWIVFESGADLALSLEDTLTLFGATSKEYEFANGYYSYISPSGRFPSKLRFAKVSQGEAPIDAFKNVDKSTNAFGSFTFLTPDSGESSTASSTDDFLAELVAVASYNHTLDAKYLFVVNLKMMGGTQDAINAVEACEKFRELTGCCFVYGSTDVSAYMPMAVLGSTDYQNGQVVNFMFKQFGTEEPSVFDNATYTTLNQGLVNFYGQTQSNGQTLSFFQRGFNTDGTDIAIYCNEMWFKAECETGLLDLLLSSERLPADQVGITNVKLAVTDVCSIATRNGCFMQKELSTKDTRKVREIVQLSDGDETDVEGIAADISSKGYSVYAYLSELSDPDKLGRDSEKIIVYYVFYGTADSVRYIKGNDILLK